MEYALKTSGFPFSGKKILSTGSSMVLGIRDLPLETALEEEPWQGLNGKKEKCLKTSNVY